MDEIKIINDFDKKNNLKVSENFLSNKQYNYKEKIKLNKFGKHIDNLNIIENKENFDNINIAADTNMNKNKRKNFSINSNLSIKDSYNPQIISVIKKKNSGLIKNIKNNAIPINERSKENNSTNIKNNNNKKKLNEKKTKSFNQKIIDNCFNEENKAKKQKKNTSFKDIIEKLKVKSFKKEEGLKKEKEEKIKEISRNINEKENIPKEENNSKEKNKKNIDIKNKVNIPKKNEKKKSNHNKTHSKNESILLPHKSYRDENDEDEINYNNIIKRNYSSSKFIRESKKEKMKKLKDKEIYNKRKKLNSIDTTFNELNQNKEFTNTEKNNNTYKNLENSNITINNTINIYKPKKPSLIKVGSRLKIGTLQNPLIDKNNLKMKNEIINNNIKSTKNILEQRVNFDINCKIPYIKKPQINFFNMYNSFFDIKNESFINGNNNNISCFDINNVNNLNSSFDSLIRYNNNYLYGINLNNNIINNMSNLGRITQSSLQNTILDNYNMNKFSQFQLINNNNPSKNFNLCYNSTNNGMGINNKNYSSLNIEDLLILDEKFYEIIKSLNISKIVYNECFEFWNYYFNCSLYGKLEKLFTNIYDSNEVNICINYILMSVLICYDYSFNFNIMNNSCQIFDNILKLNRISLILIFKYILTKISNDNRDNIWVFKLNDLVNSNLNLEKIEYKNLSIVEIITNNNRIIMQKLFFLLKTFKTENNIYICDFVQNLRKKNQNDIDILFRERIFRVENINGSVLASIFLKGNYKFKTEPAPYLKTINRKPFSLVLDLDETLVHFKVNPDNGNEGVLRIRPGINEFLENVDKYYELIIFTAATQEYADLLIDAVEENKIFFEHRLYRQHTIIIGNDFIKDLSRVGRPLDKIAIVDNMPQNFRLQKENGINIKAFWGEEINDTALVNLGKILVNIAKDGGDIRDGIYKYKDDIVKKVTSNLCI